MVGFVLCVGLMQSSFAAETEDIEVKEMQSESSSVTSGVKDVTCLGLIGASSFGVVAALWTVKNSFAEFDAAFALEQLVNSPQLSARSFFLGNVSILHDAPEYVIKGKYVKGLMERMATMCAAFSFLNRQLASAVTEVVTLRFDSAIKSALLCTILAYSIHKILKKDAEKRPYLNKLKWVAAAIGAGYAAYHCSR